MHYSYSHPWVWTNWSLLDSRALGLMGNEQSIIWLRVIAFDRVQSPYLGTTRCDWFEFNWCKSGYNFMQPPSLALLHALFQVTRSCTRVVWAVTVSPHMSRCLIKWTSISPESPSRCTAICKLPSDNKHIIVDHLISLEKSTWQNLWSIRTRDLMPSLSWLCDHFCW